VTPATANDKGYGRGHIPDVGPSGILINNSHHIARESINDYVVIGHPTCANENSHRGCIRPFGLEPKRKRANFAIDSASQRSPARGLQRGAEVEALRGVSQQPPSLHELLFDQPIF
jgi:hypothetical protein